MRSLPNEPVITTMRLGGGGNRGGGWVDICEVRMVLIQTGQPLSGPELYESFTNSRIG
jgi:hypothetical protein